MINMVEENSNSVQETTVEENSNSVQETTVEETPAETLS